MQPQVRDILSIDIYDGDTMRVVIDQGWKDTKKLSIRMNGIDCPEISTEAGVSVAEAVRFILKDRPVKQLRLLSIKLDMYGRSLGDILIETNLNRIYTLSSILLANKIAKPMKIKRPKWSIEELYHAKGIAEDLLLGRRWYPEQ